MAQKNLILPEGDDIVGRTLAALAPEATQLLDDLGGIPRAGQAIVTVTILVWREGRLNRASSELTVSAPPQGGD